METANAILRWRLRHRDGGDGLPTLYERVAYQIDMGIQVMDVFSKMAAQAAKRYSPQHLMAVVLGDIARRVRSGDSVASAMRPWVPKEDLALLSIGESAGGEALSGSLKRLAKLKRMRKRLIGNARKAMIEPLVLFGVMYGMLIYMGSPSFSVLFNMGGPNGGAMISVLKDLAEMSRGWGMLILPALLVVFVATSLLTMPMGGRVRRAFDSIPPWSIYRDIQAAVWLSSYAALLMAGIDEKRATALLTGNASAWLRERLDIIYSGFREGYQPGTALDEAGMQFLSDDVVDTMAAIAGSGDLPSRLNEMADIEETRVEKRVAGATQIIVVVMNMLVYLLFLLLIAGIGSLMTSMGSTPGM